MFYIFLQQTVVLDDEIDRRSDEEASLDPNHSHFILVDDGSTNTYGADVMVRSQLERHIKCK